MDSVHATLFDQTLYELLGVARDADDKAIKDAFRKERVRSTSTITWS